jgi:Uma2 family endonuclease
MAQPAPEPTRPLSVEEYLRGELASETRHEYIGGQVYAMVGASDAHNLIAMNLATALHGHLRGGPCQVFMADMKARVAIAGEDVFYYPDLLVSCRPDDRARYWRTHPCLIVEVLSETTARTDRREKLLAYREIDALEEYLLVDQDAPQVTLLRRADAWQPRRLDAADTLRLDSVGLEIPVAEIYEGVDLTPGRE